MLIIYFNYFPQKGYGGGGTLGPGVYLDDTQLFSFRARKIFFKKDGVEFHQKLIGTIVRPILEDEIDKKLYKVKCHVKP